MDLKREGFHWCKREAGRIPGMGREPGIDLVAEQYIWIRLNEYENSGMQDWNASLQSIFWTT